MGVHVQWWHTTGDVVRCVSRWMTVRWFVPGFTPSHNSRQQSCLTRDSSVPQDSHVSLLETSEASDSDTTPKSESSHLVFKLFPWGVPPTTLSRTAVQHFSPFLLWEDTHTGQTTWNRNYKICSIVAFLSYEYSLFSRVTLGSLLYFGELPVIGTGKTYLTFRQELTDAC